MEHIALWKKHSEELTRSNTGILLVIQNSDEETVINALKSVKVTFPFIIDRGKKFKVKNIKALITGTFVMNKNRKVIFTGSPIATEETWISFVKLVN
jgi:hypothetical protein